MRRYSTAANDLTVDDHGGRGHYSKVHHFHDVGHFDDLSSHTGLLDRFTDNFLCLDAFGTTGAKYLNFHEKNSCQIRMEIEKNADQTNAYLANVPSTITCSKRISNEKN